MIGRLYHEIHIFSNLSEAQPSYGGEHCSFNCANTKVCIICHCSAHALWGAVLFPLSDVPQGGLMLHWWYMYTIKVSMSEPCVHYASIVLVCTLLAEGHIEDAALW